MTSREKHKLLFISIRPSDFSEMYRAAISFANRGHSVSLLYHYDQISIEHHREVLAKLNMLFKAGDFEAVGSVTDRQIMKADIRFGCGTSDGVYQKGIVENKGVWIIFKTYINQLFRAFSHTVLFIQKNYWKFKSIVKRLLLSIGLMKTADFINEFLITLNITIRNNRFLRKYARYLLALRTHYKYLYYFKILLSRNKYDCIFIPEDIVGPVWPVVIKAGHLNNIPTIVLPYTIANQEEAFQSLKKNCDFQTSENWVISRLFPKWRLNQHNYDLVRLPGAYIFAQEIYKLSPPKPWLMNSGFANAICAENNAMREYMVTSGIPESKVYIVGSVSDDMLHEYHSNKRKYLESIKESLGISSSKPILLIGGFPNQLDGNVPDCEFSRASDIAEFIIECLRPLCHYWEIVVRPHPNFEELGGYFEKAGYTVTTHETAQLIAISDLYLAFASATIRWAVAVGVPVINYDVFFYDFSEYNNIGGVSNVKYRNEFQDVFKDMIPENEVYQRNVRDIQKEKNNWGILDGSCIERLESLVDELTSLTKIPRTTE